MDAKGRRVCVRDTPALVRLHCEIPYASNEAYWYQQIMFHRPFRTEDEFLSKANKAAGTDSQYKEECFLRGLAKPVESDLDNIKNILRDTKDPATFKKLSSAIRKLEAEERSERFAEYTGPSTDSSAFYDELGYEPAKYVFGGGVVPLL